MKAQRLTPATTATEPADAELVVACRAGGAQAAAGFRIMFRRYQDKVRATLFRLGAREGLDDQTQEVFLRIWRGLPQLREPSHLGTWVYRLAVNVAADSLRERHAQTPPADYAEDAAPGPDAFKALSLQRSADGALASLSFEQRTVLVLHDLEGLTLDEIANAAGIPLGTAKSRLFHARQNAANYLRARGVEDV